MGGERSLEVMWEGRAVQKRQQRRWSERGATAAPGLLQGRLRPTPFGAGPHPLNIGRKRSN